jgi:hypothetical protein
MIWLAWFWLDLIWVGGSNQLKPNHLTHWDSYILALLYNNTTFYLTSIKPFYIKDINTSNNNSKLNSEFNYSRDRNKGKGNSSRASLLLSTNPLKHPRKRPYKNPNIIVFL